MSKSLPETFVKGFHYENLCKKMEYRTLGRTGLKVSKMSFGSATLSNLYGDFDVEDAIKAIQQAAKTGINYFDTAPYYGQGRAEEILGMAFKSMPRQAYYVATKVGRYERAYHRMFDFSAKRTRESVEQSLKRLGLDYVDVIQIHDIDFDENLEMVINECLPELEKLVKEGKARYVGVTGYTLECLKDCIERAPGRLDLVLSYARYTLIDDSLLSYVDYFQKKNLGLVCAAGHALGLLTNRGPQPWHFACDELKQMCQKAANICKTENVELGKLAMYYFIQLEGASTFLVGIQTQNLLAINLNALHSGLTKKEQEVLKLLKDTVFTKKMDWQGVELQLHRSAVEEMKNSAN